MTPVALNLSGSVHGVLYKNTESGYAALRFKADAEAQVPYRDPRGCITIIGSLAGISVGQRMSIQGQLVNHRKYGPQVQVEHFVFLEPKDITDIVLYLAENIPYVDRYYAGKIVEKFGTDTLRILDEDPDRLREIKGFGEKRIEGTKKAWEELRSLRSLLMLCSQVGLGHGFVARIHKKYGDGSEQVIRTDPYRLARDIHGIGFQKADEVARALGIPEVSDMRICAAALHQVEQRADQRGDCFVYQSDLVGETHQFLNHPDITEAMVASVVQAAIEIGILVAESNRIYCPDLHEAECNAADLMRKLLAAPLPEELRGEALEAAIATAVASTGLELHQVQIDAIDRSMRSKVSIITGGPGVGKTTITKAVVAGYEKAGLPITLMAPTGARPNA